MIFRNSILVALVVGFCCARLVHSVTPDEAYGREVDRPESPAIELFERSLRPRTPRVPPDLPVDELRNRLTTARQNFAGQMRLLNQLELSPEERVRRVDQASRDLRTIEQALAARQNPAEQRRSMLLAQADRLSGQMAELNAEERAEAIARRGQLLELANADTPEERIRINDRYSPGPIAIQTPEERLAERREIARPRPGKSAFREKLDEILREDLSPEEHIRRVDQLMEQAN